MIRSIAILLLPFMSYGWRSDGSPVFRHLDGRFRIAFPVGDRGLLRHEERRYCQYRCVPTRSPYRHDTKGYCHPSSWGAPLANVAALETVAAMRLNDGRGDPAANGVANEFNNIDRTIAIVEAASDRIRANDYSAVETLFAGQALALDAMFDKHARENAYDDIRLALRSQQQCRATFRALMQMKYLRDEKFSRKRNEEPPISPG